MQLADFPIFAAALANLPDYAGRDGVVRNPGQRARHRVESTERALAALTQGLEAGSIMNQSYIDAKQSINRSFEEAWQSREDRLATSIYHRDAPESVQKFFMNFLYPQAHLVAGHIKKLEKLPQDDVQVAVLLPFLREIAPIADAVQALKDKVVKRQPKSEEEKRAERYAVPHASLSATKIVTTLLEEIVAKHYDALVASFTKQYNGVLDRFLEAQALADKDPTLNQPESTRRDTGETYYTKYYSPHWHCTIKEGPNKGQTNGNLYILLLVLKREQKGFSSTRYVPEPDARSIIAEEAVKTAKMIRDDFVGKNRKKIVSILDGKGDANFAGYEVLGHELSLGGLTGTIRFTFRDGAAFTVKNQIVWSTSTLGKWFPRYPLTFHDVLMAGGVKMPSPSEKRMNTVFLGKEEA